MIVVRRGLHHRVRARATHLRGAQSDAAQKLVLNMLTTASMIRSGECYQSLVVYLKPTNMKLAGRATLIVTQATGRTTEQAHEALKRTGNNVKLAILIALTACLSNTRRWPLKARAGFLRKAIA
jgi:N-acetylmuramic acid 6-phosphate etherase